MAELKREMFIEF